MRAIITILMLILSNTFMTLAWYGHLKFKEWGLLPKAGLFLIVLISWGLAFFEYCLQVPANRLGYQEYGGPFSLFQLKVIQEVITLSVFAIFALVFFRNEILRWNHLAACICLVMAVYFVFKK